MFCELKIFKNTGFRTNCHCLLCFYEHPVGLYSVGTMWLVLQGQLCTTFVSARYLRCFEAAHHALNIFFENAIES